MEKRVRVIKKQEKEEETEQNTYHGWSLSTSVMCRIMSMASWASLSDRMDGVLGMGMGTSFFSRWRYPWECSEVTGLRCRKVYRGLSGPSSALTASWKPC
jgi:hypothetical protein